MQFIITLILFILILGVIVLVHEFGHFFFARKFGVHAYEFSIGMGPKIWGTKPKKGKTPFNIRAIPIGGYVSLAGEEVDDDDKSVPKNAKLFNKPIWQRFLIMFFGAGNNFILAFLILFGIALFVGAPSLSPVVNDVVKDSPAEKAGLRKGDVITNINGNNIYFVDDVQVYIIMASKDATSTFKIKRGDEEREFKIKPVLEKDEDGNESYKFGVVYNTEKTKGFLTSIKFAIKKIVALCHQMIVVICNLVNGNLGLKSLSGPVGIFSIVGEAKSTGVVNIFYLIALLSVNIGFVNLIPLPAFDGGRIFFLIIEAIKGSPVNPKIENTIHNIGFILLMILMLVITFNDILKIF